MARQLSAEGGGATSETGRFGLQGRAVDVGGRVVVAVATVLGVSSALPLLDIALNSSSRVNCVALEAAGVNL